MESKFILPTDQHELDLCKSLPTDHLFSFDPMKYTRETSQEHKLEPPGLKCVMPGIAQKNLSGIFEVFQSPNPVKRRRSQYVLAPGDTGVFWKTRRPSCGDRECLEGGEDCQRRINTTTWLRRVNDDAGTGHS